VDAVPAHLGDAHSPAWGQADFFFLTSDDCFTRNGEPVFASVDVALETEPLAGFNLDPLDLVIGFIGEDGIVAPRFVVSFTNEHGGQTFSKWWKKKPERPPRRIQKIIDVGMEAAVNW